jgi:hypothetical protein
MDPGPLAAGVAALAVISIFLGWQTGKGSAVAVIVLLGHSASRGLTTYLGIAPEWWATWPGITLLELVVFGQGVRGAIALAQEERRALRRRVAARHAAERQASGAAEAPTASQVRVPPQPVVAAKPVNVAKSVETQPSPVAQRKAEFIPLHLEPFDATDTAPQEEIWARPGFMDFVVVGLVALYSLKLMSTRVSHSEGLQGVPEALEVMFGFFNMALAVLLLIGSRAASRQKGWGIRLRKLVYLAFAFQFLAWLRIKF